MANGITAKNQIVFSQGDPSDAVFYVEGKVKVTVVSEQGKDAVVAILGANDFFGEACLAGQTKRIATVTTMTESVIARLEKAAVVRLLQVEPAFSECPCAPQPYKIRKLDYTKALRGLLAVGE